MSLHHNINYCFTKEEPLIPASSASKKDIKDYKWFRSNRMAKNVIKFLMSKTVRDSVDEPGLATEFMEAIAAKLKKVKRPKQLGSLRSLIVLSTQVLGVSEGIFLS